ncbi:MAG: galactose-1-epimerase, partial [Bacteroidota bacterium]
MKYISLLSIIFLLVGCQNQAPKGGVEEIEKDLPVLLVPAAFKREVDGKAVNLYTLKNKNGLVTQITNYGGRVVNLWVPDREGNFADVVLGYEALDGYLTPKGRYYGAIIGRYGNRIGKGSFVLEGKQYVLAANNGENHLHGGIKGFNAVVWEANQPNEQTLILSYLSTDGEEGYPGNLKV